MTVYSRAMSCAGARTAPVGGAGGGDAGVPGGDVVRGGEDGAGGGPPQDHRVVGRTAVRPDRVREVRHARGDQVDRDRPPLLVLEDRGEIGPDDGWISTHGS